MTEILVWSIDEIASGYLEMAEINLALAEDFAPLEDEVQIK